MAPQRSRDSGDAHLAEQIEGGIAARAEGGGSAVGAHLTGVLAQRDPAHVLHVLQAVLDLPVSPPDLSPPALLEPCGIRLRWRHTRHGGSPLGPGLACPRATDIRDLARATADLGQRGSAGTRARLAFRWVQPFPLRKGRDDLARRLQRAPLLALAMPLARDHHPLARRPGSAKLKATASNVSG